MFLFWVKVLENLPHRYTCNVLKIVCQMQSFAPFLGMCLFCLLSFAHSPLLGQSLTGDNTISSTYGFTQGQDFVGIGTITPLAGLHVYGSSVLFDRAEPEAFAEGAVPVSGEGTRFVWVPNKPALRAGTITEYIPTGWDAGSVGNNSYSLGQNAVVEGYSSAAIGNSIWIPKMSEYSSELSC
jgi:hypothetical protein